MSLYNVADMKAALGGGVSMSDQALGDELQAIEDAIALRWGAEYPGPLTDRLAGGSRLLVLRRPALSITRVTQIYGAGATRAFTTDDWLLRPSGMSLLRIPFGWDWPRDVEVVYVPQDDTSERKRIQIAVMKAELGYSGIASQTIDGYSESSGSGSGGDYASQRQAIIDSYALPRVP